MFVRNILSYFFNMEQKFFSLVANLNLIAACEPNPCLHGGKCFEEPETDDRYRCECISGYYGKKCESKWNYYIHILKLIYYSFFNHKCLVRCSLPRKTFLWLVMQFTSWGRNAWRTPKNVRGGAYVWCVQKLFLPSPIIDCAIKPP